MQLRKINELECYNTLLKDIIIHDIELDSFLKLVFVYITFFIICLPISVS